MLALPSQPAHSFHDRPSSVASSSSTVSRPTSSLSLRSSSSSPASNGTSASPSPTAKDTVNPLYVLSERVVDGEILPVHLWRVSDRGEICAGQGEPTFLSSWNDHPLELTDKGRKMGGKTLVLHTSTDEGDDEPVSITHFKDHEFKHSTRDAVRMVAHDIRRETKELMNYKGKGKAVSSTSDDSVTNALDHIAVPASGSGGNAKPEAGEGLSDEDAGREIGHSHSHDFSSSSFVSADSHLNGASPSSSYESIPLTSATPPPLDAGREHHRRRAPPDDLLATSRTSPSPLSVPPTEHPPLTLANGTPSIPLPYISTTSTLHPPAPFEPSDASRYMRRANTTGSPSLSSSSRLASAASSPRLGTSLHPQRTQSYTNHPQRSFSVTSDPYGPATAVEPGALDDVDASIAAQAEVIRKERHEKRLEQAKEREESAKAGPSAGVSSLRRRSTRAGSGSEGGFGTGVLVGNLIGQDHANYVLMYNMLTGIRIGVSRCQAKLKRPLTDADYTARHKFSFDIVGNELTPSTKYDFKFKDYAPWVFRELREYFYLDPSDYLVSLTAKYILSELGSPGKSGAFFYFSRDYRFIIKTIRHSEHKFLRSILKEYYEYVKNNPHTLLSRFYGLHRVKLPHGKKIHFVIMNNLFPPHRDIHERYDLKGSAVGRITPEAKAQANPNAILKDQNWINRGRQLALGPEKKALFEEQLRRDTALMQKLGIMDYSLLTGIHNAQRGNADNLRNEQLTVFQPDTVKVRRRQPTQVKRDADASALRQAIQRSDPKALSDANGLPDADTSERRRFLFYQDEGGIRATGDDNEDLGVIYYLGIIDILTPYGIMKKLEHFFRGLKHDPHMISAVPPQEYGERFLAFIKSTIRGNDPSQRPRMDENEPKKGKGKETEKVKVE